MIIFEKSHVGARATSQLPILHSTACAIPQKFLRADKPVLPEVSELEVVRHFTRLSQKNFSIDTHFYPLGSCTMKYNPRGVHRLAMMPEFLGRHPLRAEKYSQGFLSCCFELQDLLKEVTGMQGVCLTPMAGAQGEFAGVRMIQAYHLDRGDLQRTEMIVPDSAHGTNPASAAICGFEIKEVATAKNGDINLEALRQVVGPKTAGIMLTNPSTLGLFERNIVAVAEIIHQAGGLLYYDGANLNAILGTVRPGDMGFDVIHMNVHKTFATPHGGGGPGGGPIAVGERLLPYLPIPIVCKKDEQYYWSTKQEYPKSIGRLNAFMGNAGILLRAYIYIRLLGKEGLKRVGEYATLNANYVMTALHKAGFELAFPERRASHEFIVTMASLYKETHVSAMDVAKRLLDYGFHAPTTYFPLLVPECLLIEPTETESKGQLDAFIVAMKAILEEASKTPEIVRAAPVTQPVHRLDDVKAVKDLAVIWKPIDGLA